MENNNIPILKNKNPINNIENNNYILLNNENNNNPNGINVKLSPDNIHKVINFNDNGNVLNNNNIQFNKNNNPLFMNIYFFDENDGKIKFPNNRLQLTNPENLSIIPEQHEMNLSSREKIKQFIDLIIRNKKQEFYSRLSLNYLHKNKVNLNNEELIALLKLGKNNNYEKILNNSLKLNLVKDDYKDKNILYKDWVKKFTFNDINLENKLKSKKNNFYPFDEPDFSVFPLATIRKKNQENYTHRNKRDTTNDIIMPDNLNHAYNLLRNKKEYEGNELLREFRDEADKF